MEDDFNLYSPIIDPSSHAAVILLATSTQTPFVPSLSINPSFTISKKVATIRFHTSNQSIGYSHREEDMKIIQERAAVKESKVVIDTFQTLSSPALRCAGSGSLSVISTISTAS